MTERGLLPVKGTVEDLAALGLTLEQAVGRRFVFRQWDHDVAGRSDDLMWNGVVIRDPKFGILLEGDEDGFYRRSGVEG